MSTVQCPQVRRGGAGAADPGPDVRSDHGGDEAGAAELVEAVLQPADGEELRFPALGAEDRHRLVHLGRLRRPVLPGPPHGAPAAGLVPLPARLRRACLGRVQRLAAPAAGRPHAVAGHCGGPGGDGVPLVHRRPGAGAGGLRLCLLLRPFPLGGDDQDDGLAARPGGAGCLLPQTRRVAAGATVQQALLIAVDGTDPPQSLLPIFGFPPLNHHQLLIFHCVCSCR